MKNQKYIACMCAHNNDFYPRLDPLHIRRTRIHSNATCSGIKLVDFDTTSSSTSCCPTDSLSCGGCAKYASSKCERCKGGFLLKDGKCTACISTVGWTNELGETCDALTAADCNDRPVNGLSSNQACCQCNGGEKSATPFTYPDTRFAVGAAVELKPVPRTAERYSVNADCGFAAHNLTIDGATGAIKSTKSPTKPFTVQCEVTAHQAVHLVSTVKVTVAVEFMSYGAGALFFSSSVTSYPVALASAAADWTDFGMVCAPEAPWLGIASSGVVSTSSSTSGGAVTEAETSDADFVGIDGAVCVVSAKQKSGDEFEKRSTTFVALKPRPWPELTFESSYVEVVVGEELAPMKPKVPSGYEEGSGGLKPSPFHVNRAEYFVGSPGHSFLRPHDFLLQLLEFVMCWFSARFWYAGLVAEASPLCSDPCHIVEPPTLLSTLRKMHG